METDPVVGVKLLRKFIESLSDKIARTNDVLRHTADYDANTGITAYSEAPGKYFETERANTPDNETQAQTHRKVHNIIETKSIGG